MEIQKAFQAVMSSAENMALATCVGDKPNVRIVTFGYDQNSPKTVYFTTFQGNQKIVEFQQNPHVTFMPLPESADASAQVRVHGCVRLSSRSLEDVAPLIIEKAPDFAETVKQAGPMLLVYEIVFDEAWVTIGMTDAQKLVL